MYAENQTKWLSEYLQAELTIVSTSQTKHLIPCFQYEFYKHQYKAYEGIVMTYLHKTKPNSRIESKKA